MDRDSSYLIGNQHAKGSKPNKTSFKKGHPPWNKNLKGIRMSIGTEFKKGMTPKNKLPVGSITIRTTKSGKQRNFIKIAEPNVWQEYTKYMWRSVYGKIIKGDVVHHLNGNTLDDSITNIIAFPRADHPIFHGRWGLKQLTDEQLEYYKSRY